MAIIIPASRTTVFNPGRATRIPARSAYPIHDTLTPTGGDDTALINNALLACPAFNAIKLADGATFRLTDVNTYVRVPSQVELRGGGSSGVSKTTILRESTHPWMVMVGYEAYPNEYSNWTACSSGYTVGSTALTVADATGFAAGQYIILTQQDTGNPDGLTIGGATANKIGPTDTPGPKPPWASSDYASFAQICKIASVAGNVLNLESRIHYDFTADCNPYVGRMGTGGALVEDAGVSDLYLKRTVRSFTNTGGSLILSYAAGCWARNVEVYKGEGRMFQMQKSYRCHFESCFAHHAWAYQSGGLAYGTTIGTYTTDSLIEDHITWFFNAGMTIEACGPGNVIGYCHGEGVWLDEGSRLAQNGIVNSHYSWPLKVLIEGCQGAKVVLDSAHGNAFNWTIFRCALNANYSYWPTPDQWPDLPAPPGVMSFRSSLFLQGTNDKMNVVGCVLCDLSDGAEAIPDVFSDGGDTQISVKRADAGSAATLYWHGNWDGFNNAVVWDAGNADHVIPDSLYLSAAPPWWTGGKRWPPVDPLNATRVVDIPAKDRFRVLTALAPYNVTPPVIEGEIFQGEMLQITPGAAYGQDYPTDTFEWYREVVVTTPNYRRPAAPRFPATFRFPANPRFRA